MRGRDEVRPVSIRSPAGASSTSTVGTWRLHRVIARPASSDGGPGRFEISCMVATEDTRPTWEQEFWAEYPSDPAAFEAAVRSAAGVGVGIEPPTSPAACLPAPPAGYHWAPTRGGLASGAVAMYRLWAPYLGYMPRAE